MTKQKAKNLAKPSGDATTPDEQAAPAVMAPLKPAGKRKARRAQAAGQGAAVAVKAAKAGKGKLKEQRKRVRPKGKAAVSPEPAPEPLLKSMLTALIRKPSAKARRPARLPPIERLEAAVEEVRLGGRASPRTRKLQASGVPKMAQKVIEEAAEVAIEAVRGDRTALINESVDLLYNWVVLLSGAGVRLAEIWAEMERREVSLGMAEKLPKITENEI